MFYPEIMRYNMHIFAFAISIMIVVSCCTTKPVIVEKKDCDEKAIERYMQDCMKHRTANWEVHFKRCNEEAKAEYCKKLKYLIVDGVQTPCDSVSEKIKINNKNYTHPNKIITGSEIKTTDGALSKHAVFLKIRGWGQDKQIADNEQIELDKSEIKHFFTTPLNITEG